MSRTPSRCGRTSTLRPVGHRRFIYRGRAYAGLLGGRYVSGDFGSGRVFYSTASGLRTAGSLPQVTGFGEDATRELWAVTLGGGLYRMVARA